MCCSPFAPIQILTGDTRKGWNTRRGRLHDDGRSFQRKSWIERRFESSPESRGSQTSGVLLVLFVQAKRIKSFPLQGVSKFCKPRISAQNQNFARTKLNPLPLCLPPHGRLAHVRSQFSLFRRSPTHKNLPLATFCTSERAFWLLFARRKKWQLVLFTENIEVWQTSNQHTKTTTSHKPN